MTESERLKLHIWSLDESRDGPAMAELRHVIAGMAAGAHARRDDSLRDLLMNRGVMDQEAGQQLIQAPSNWPFGDLYGYNRRYESD